MFDEIPDALLRDACGLFPWKALEMELDEHRSVSLARALWAQDFEIDSTIRVMIINLQILSNHTCLLQPSSELSLLNNAGLKVQGLPEWLPTANSFSTH